MEQYSGNVDIFRRQRARFGFQSVLMYLNSGLNERFTLIGNYTFVKVIEALIYIVISQLLDLELQACDKSVAPINQV